MGTVLAAMPALRHAYGSSTPYSIGIEEEFQLIAASDGALVPRIDPIMELVDAAGETRIKPELMQSVVEVATSPCTSLGEADAELRGLRRQLTSMANEAGDYLLASAGTHPFSRWDEQAITDKERYHAIIDRMQWVARRELIFGLHVHVGIDTPDKMMAIFNAIRMYLPHLLALSANSPFWQGEPTGLHSTRSKVFDSFPRSGLPQEFAGGYEEWSALVQRSVAAGAIKDYTYIWWDVRPHPDFGTIELRVADAQTKVEGSLALAALIQATCAWLGARHERGEDIIVPPTFLIAENKWAAARYGLDGTFIDFDNDSTVDVRTALGNLFETTRPYATALGAEEQFAHLDAMLIRGGAQRQLDAYAASGSLNEVALQLAADTMRA